MWESESESVAIIEKSHYRGIILLSLRSVTYRESCYSALFL